MVHVSFIDGLADVTVMCIACVGVAIKAFWDICSLGKGSPGSRRQWAANERGVVICAGRWGDHVRFLYPSAMNSRHTTAQVP